MKQSHLIGVNTLIIWGTTVLQMIPPLVMVPFLIRNLGDSGYGQYALIWSLLMAIEQLENSLQSGGVKYGAAFLAQGRIGDLNKVLSSTSVFSVALGTLSCLSIGAVALLGFAGSPQMMISLIIVGIMMLFLVPTTPYLGIIRTKQRHYVCSLAAILAQYAGLLIAVLWFRFVGPSVAALIAISAGTLLISRLAQIPVAYRMVPGLQNKPKHFDWEIFRYILAFGAMTVLAALCMIANGTGIRWLSGLLVSTSFVAHLAIFLMPGALVSQVVQAMTITVMPAASAYQATQDHELLQELFLRTTRYIVLLVSAVLIVSVLLIRGILRLWVGPPYEFLGVYVLVNLAGVGLLLSASCAHHMLKGFGDLRRVIVAYVVGLVVIPFAVTLAVFLIWKSPYVAVSAGLLLGNFTAGIIQVVACGKTVRMNMGRFLVRAYLQPLAPAAAIMTVMLLTIAVSGWGGLVSRFLLASLSVLLLFGTFYFIVAGADERRQFREFLQMVLGRVTGLASRMSPSKTGTDV